MIVIGLLYLLSIIFLTLASIGVQSRFNLFALGVLFFVLALGFPNLGIISLKSSFGVSRVR